MRSPYPKRLLATALVSVLALAGLAGCGAAPQQPAPAAQAPKSEAPKAEAPKSEAPKDKIAVKLAVPVKSIQFAYYYLGQEKGLYAAEGVDMEIQIMPANTALAAVLNGELDFTTAGGSAMRAALQGSPVRAVFVPIGKSMFFIYGKKELADIKALKGKNIGTTSVAGTVAVVAKKILKAEGIDPEKDLQFIAHQTITEAWISLKGGSIDAAVVDPPFDGMAANAGFKLLAKASDYVKSTQAVMATSTKNIQGNPEKVKRAIRGTLRALDYFRKNEAEVIDYLAKTWNLSKEEAQGAYKTVLSGLTKDGIAETEALVAELGENAKPEDVSRTVDFTLLKQVQKELGMN